MRSPADRLCAALGLDADYVPAEPVVMVAFVEDCDDPDDVGAYDDECGCSADDCMHPRRP
jgi:hypothetical protein